MKKSLLTLAAAALAMSASAASYTVFDIANPGVWETKGTGFTQTKTVDGVTFTITTDKASSTTNLISPDNNKYAWRVYKDSKVTIESSVAMKSMVITFDDYTVDGKGYANEWTLEGAWTGALDGVVYTLSNADGSTTFSGVSAISQTRVKTIVVSTDGSVTPPPAGDSDVVYENAFSSSLSDWSNSDPGWYINNTIKCAVANSYKDGQNVAADYILSKEFDLAGRSDCAMSVDTAYGFDFPQTQDPSYTVLVREAGESEWNQLVLTNFPAVPEKNWSKFVNNSWDLSEWDGMKIEIGFRYLTDGSKSRAWELQNFKLTGKTEGAVAGVEVEENAAPVYYNLQGARVNNPERGIYIQVKGNKATKVML